MKATETFTDLRQAILDASIDYYNKRSTQNRHKQKHWLYHLPYRQIFAAMFAVCATVVLCKFLFSFCLPQSTPSVTSHDLEDVIASETADVIVNSEKNFSEITVLSLISKNNTTYSRRVNKIAELLSQSGLIVNQHWITASNYDPDNYSDNLTQAMSRFPNAKALIVIAAGGVVHATPNYQLLDFLNDNTNQLILLGSGSLNTAIGQLTKQSNVLFIRKQRSFKSIKKEQDCRLSSYTIYQKMFKHYGNI